MSIELFDKRNTKTVELSELRFGDTFMYENDLYIKATTPVAHGNDINVVTLGGDSSGKSETFPYKLQVQQVSLVINIHLV